MLPTEDNKRKDIDLTAQWKLFPRATIALAEHIKFGADKYCGGEIKWDRSKSPNEKASAARHLFELIHEEGNVDAAKALAWRGMANLEKVLEKADCHCHVGKVTYKAGELPADLYEFLRSENALEAFLANWDGNEYRFGDDIKSWISSAFSWDETREGFDYWVNLHSIWQEYCDEMEEA